MAAFRTGEVLRVIEEHPDLIRVAVALPSGAIEASGFPSMLGPLAAGDRVVVNTTGLELELGTGGEGFVLWNLDGPESTELGPGHIVKMRYTPWQTEVMAAEEPDSDHHEVLAKARDIAGMPVVVCSLHSHVGPVAAAVKASLPEARVGYLMTDGAALPMAWSKNVRELERKELLDVTCTSGHAFGGDLEAVNVFSGLVALRHAGEVDVAVVAMGPGVVGTATPLGSTAMEQGQILDAVSSLGGRAVAALRISFADRRERHLGISHHSVTALTVAATQRCTVAVPVLPAPQDATISEQLTRAGIADRHDVVVVDAGPGLRELGRRGIRPTSMGRSIDETPELFASAAAAGTVAVRSVTPGESAREG